MKRKELIEKLTEFYQEFESLVTDESIMNFGKKFTKLNDKLGELIQELEDEKEDEND